MYTPSGPVCVPRAIYPSSDLSRLQHEHSYTDRILWKSAHGMANDVVPFLYEPCPGFTTSDHKPVRGGYLVKTKKG